MNIRYLTIEREYGSGGTEIARTLARSLEWSCYGREIMEMAANRLNISVDALEDYEERVSGSILYSMYVMSQSQTGDPDLVSREGKLYVEESRIIRELANIGPAIFIGHAAGYVLRQEPGLVRVFIHADEPDKQQRIREEYGIAPADVASTCRRFNRRRSNYYHFCTGNRWSDSANYDLVLDSSRLGTDGCIRALRGLLTP